MDFFTNVWRNLSCFLSCWRKSIDEKNVVIRITRYHVKLYGRLSIQIINVSHTKGRKSNSGCELCRASTVKLPKYVDFIAYFKAVAYVIRFPSLPCEHIGFFNIFFVWNSKRFKFKTNWIELLFELIPLFNHNSTPINDLFVI